MVVCKVALAVASTFTLRPGTSRRAVTSTWISGPKTTNIINFTYTLFYYCGYKNLLRMQRFVNFSQQMLHFWPLVWILGPRSINNKNWKKSITFFPLVKMFLHSKHSFTIKHVAAPLFTAKMRKGWSLLCSVNSGSCFHGCAWAPYKHASVLKVWLTRSLDSPKARNLQQLVGEKGHGCK